MRLAILLLLLLITSLATKAQDIYGFFLDKSDMYMGSYGYHSNVFNSFYNRPCNSFGATSDLKDNYYYITFNCGTINYEVKLHNLNVVTQNHRTIDINSSLIYPEYDGGNLWGIGLDSPYVYPILKCDAMTGDITVYDTLFPITSREAHDVPTILHSAFNHVTQTYYFTGAVNGMYDSMFFYQYHIPTKTFSRQRIPSYVYSFDYSPLNNRAYLFSANTGSEGIYEYNIGNNTMVQVYSGYAGGGHVTIDPVKNRLYFQSNGDDIRYCRIAGLGCYRINSRTLDTFDVSGRICGVYNQEFLPTYNDTTWDPFPLAIPPVHLNKEDIEIYPNPSNSEINLRANNIVGSVAYIYNMQGQLISTTSISQNNSRLDVSTLTNEQYLLNIIMADGSFKRKLFSVIH
ncbi:MAG: T9SS type A sorting domain-containing protein [Sphingobacteriales bacterium]|nr:MAG: T9SS type A sorting domain-containing protein [Sphingobacteriales bacterium]